MSFLETNTVKVKICHLAVGLDLIGSKTSLESGRNYDIEATLVGIKIVSKSSQRTILVPYSNIKGFELLNEGAATGRTNASARAEQALAEARAASPKTVSAAPALQELPQVSEEDAKAAAQEARANARKLAREAATAKLAEEKANK